MKRLSVVLGAVMALGCLSVMSQEAQPKQDQPAVRKFKTGARPTPVPRIVESLRTGKATLHAIRGNTPVQTIVVPKKLSMLGNDQYGDCVSAESCFSIEAYSTQIGLEEIYVPDANCIAFARDHGWLNGADLLEVIQAVQSDGIKDEKGVLRKAGVPAAVDYTNEAALQNAISQGPVSIAIDSGALPNGAGNQSGWYAFGGNRHPNTDHCVSLCGYGPTAALFGALNTPVPANAPATGYLLYTWSTIGVVDHKWLQNTCVEAWLRTPTVTGLAPVTPINVAVADVVGQPGIPVLVLPLASGGTSPYTFAFDWGDGQTGNINTHAYVQVGAYKVTVTAKDSAGLTGTATATATIGSQPPPQPTPSGRTFTLRGWGPGIDGDYGVVTPGSVTIPSDLADKLRQVLLPQPKGGK